MLRRVSRNIWIAGSLGLVLLFVASGIRGRTAGPTRTGDHSSPDDAMQTEQHKREQKYQVTLRRPSGPPLIELKQPDPLGRVGRVTCSTCHGVRAPNLENRKPSDLNEFHQNMQFAHGKLVCYACHNPKDSETLRLAGGSVVDYADVMTLCAQCHGSQAKYYARGFHGGMTGYWDLSRGGRVRNNCIDCHDPHVPKFPMMRPTFKPRDRFLNPSPHNDRKADHE